MNNIKTFEQFVNENNQINEIFGIPGTPTFNEIWEKLKRFLQKINDGIRDLSLMILDKGITCWCTLVSFIKRMLDKSKSLKEKYPVIYRTILITAVLMILLFMLTSAASSNTGI